MSGPRMGNMGPMNGNRRPNNLSRMNYHDGRSSSYQDHRQCYHDHRHSSHECRHDNRPQSHDVRHEHRPHDSRPHENRPSAPQHVPQSPVYSQHEELVKFVHDAWSKVEMDNGSNNIAYYEETEGCQVKDFQPFDLEGYWGRKMHQNLQHHSS